MLSRLFKLRAVLIDHRWCRALTVLCLAVLLASPLAGQETSFSGFVEIDYFSYLKNPMPNTVNGRNQGIFQLEFSGAPSERAAFFSAVEFREDQADARRNRIYLDEAYVDLLWDTFDLRIGKQIILWGKADAINPTDLITPWDYSDVLDTEDERIGVVAAKARYLLADWELEAVFVPTFTASVLPPDGSRWLPALPGMAPNPFSPQQPPALLPVSYRVIPAALPDASLENAQVAAKISSSKRGWDFSLSYYRGWDDLAVFHQQAGFGGDSIRITIAPQYHRLQAFGGDFATTLGKFGLRGEAAWYLTDDRDGTDPDIDDPYGQYVIGLDRTFSDVLGGNNLFVLVQWIQEVTNGEFAQSNPLSHIFQRALSGRAELELGTYASFALAGVYDLERKGYFLRPELSGNPADGVTVILTADVLGGENESFFGSFEDNKRVQMRIKASF